MIAPVAKFEYARAWPIGEVISDGETGEQTPLFVGPRIASCEAPQTLAVSANQFETNRFPGRYNR